MKTNEEILKEHWIEREDYKNETDYIVLLQAMKQAQEQAVDECKKRVRLKVNSPKNGFTKNMEWANHSEEGAVVVVDMDSLEQIKKEINQK